MSRLEEIEARLAQRMPPPLEDAAWLIERVRVLEDAIREGRNRFEDLRDCRKPDDCETKARGAELVIGDIDSRLADAER